MTVHFDLAQASGVALPRAQHHPPRCPVPAAATNQLIPSTAAGWK
eukprot:CAMPEP_0204359276 /NCGR_PEP_ID=MMETSP0469-20131031/37141_1 /ASSEMBLY_ACC=CAM_ASM_000384 /TAXON_ID=2969 /ORGANISM="Oxyrrhis marina" /LENGTH=44 /DNA_ID= /DNA_START= /DNA_END= /DNA_ORIENTATION=